MPCLLSLLMTCVMSTLAAILAFCSCSSCRRTMGLRLGRLLFAFCSSWASLGENRERSVRKRDEMEKESEMDQKIEEEGESKVKIKFGRVMHVVASGGYRDIISQGDETQTFQNNVSPKSS